MDAYLDQIKAHADPERAAQMAAYHKAERTYLGVPNPVLDAVARDPANATCRAGKCCRGIASRAFLILRASRRRLAVWRRSCASRTAPTLACSSSQVTEGTTVA